MGGLLANPHFRGAGFRRGSGLGRKAAAPMSGFSGLVVLQRKTWEGGWGCGSGCLVRAPGRPRVRPSYPPSPNR